jgi:hypothetical protein
MICLETDVAGGIALSEVPQLEQKLADDIICALQEEQTIPGGVSMLHSTIQRLLSNIVSAQANWEVMHLLTQHYFFFSWSCGEPVW